MWYENKAFIAALFVDVRLNCFSPPILSQDDKEIAIVGINFLYNKTFKLKSIPGFLLESFAFNMEFVEIHQKRHLRCI